MLRADIYKRLTGILGDVFDDDSLVATPELTAADVKNWDSVSHVTLVTAVEEEFQIRFKTAELERLRNVGQMVEQIEKKTTASV